MNKFFKRKNSGEVVRCDDLRPGKVDSSGTVVRSGYECLAFVYGTPRKVGYKCDSWMNFEKHPNIWFPIEEADIERMPSEEVTKTAMLQKSSHKLTNT